MLQESDRDLLGKIDIKMAGDLCWLACCLEKCEIDIYCDKVIESVRCTWSRAEGDERDCSSVICLKFKRLVHVVCVMVMLGAATGLSYSYEHSFY